MTTNQLRPVIQTLRRTTLPPEDAGRTDGRNGQGGRQEPGSRPSAKTEKVALICEDVDPEFTGSAMDPEPGAVRMAKIEKR